MVTPALGRSEHKFDAGQNKIKSIFVEFLYLFEHVPSQ
jgi:hypothetical protein